MEMHDSALSDADLLDQLRSGDRDAYDALYRRHAAAAEAAARRIAGSRGRDDVDDVVSDAFARVLRAIDNGSGPTVAFRPYLLATVTNAWNDLARREHRDVAVEMDELAPLLTETDGSGRRAEVEVLVGAMASLPARWQQVLWLTEVEGLGNQEVGDLVGLSANGVAALALRARRGLRESYLQQHLVGRPDTAACQEIEKLLPAYADGRASATATAKVEAHLEECNECRAALLGLRTVTADLRLLLPLPAIAALGAASGGGLLLGAAAGTGAAGAGAAGTQGSGPFGALTDGLVKATAAVAASAAVVAGGWFALGLISGDDSATSADVVPRVAPSTTAVDQTDAVATPARPGPTTRPGTGPVVPDPTRTSSAPATTPASTPPPTPTPTPTNPTTPAPSATPSPTQRPTTEPRPTESGSGGIGVQPSVSPTETETAASARVASVSVQESLLPGWWRIGVQVESVARAGTVRVTASGIDGYCYSLADCVLLGSESVWQASFDVGAGDSEVVFYLDPGTVAAVHARLTVVGHDSDPHDNTAAVTVP